MMTDLHRLRRAELSLRERVFVNAIVAEFVIVLDRDGFVWLRRPSWVVH